MLNPATSKIKAAFIAPCFGIGGADGLMSSLIRHAYNIEWVGAAIKSRPTKEMVDWVNNVWDPRVPIHTVEYDMFHEGLHYHDSMEKAIYEACKDAQIIITWCYWDINPAMLSLNMPVIEYAQNSDKHATDVVEVNKSVTDYRAACSVAASKVFKDSEKVQIIYNGIDPSRVTPRTGRDLQRKVWGIDEKHTVVLFMGRLVKEKHPEDLIRALCELDDNHIGIFCGFGDKQQEIYNLAQRFCPKRIAFIESQYHVGDVLAAADCFILPSDFEGHPLALMEAMLAGIPCVYTDFSVMHELEELFGPIGWMVKRGCSSEQLAEAIVAATTINEDQFTRINNARSIVWENFTISTIAHHWEEYIEACLYDWWRKRRLTKIHPVTEAKPLERP